MTDTVLIGDIASIIALLTEKRVLKKRTNMGRAKAFIKDRISTQTGRLEMQHTGMM